MACPTGTPLALHHYTSAQGATGILEHRKMWLTHAGFLNDASEMRHLSTMLSEAIGRMLSRDDWRFWEEMGHEDVGPRSQRLLARTLDLLPDTEVRDVYVACFYGTFRTEDHQVWGPSWGEAGSSSDRGEDLLSQWRGYGGGETGVAYALTFNPERFFDATVPLYGRRMLYDRQRQEGIAGQLIDDLLNSMHVCARHRGHALHDDDLLDLASALLDAARPLAVFMKHPSFKDENEYRMIFSGIPSNDQMCFRFSAGGLVIPYLEASFNRAAITSMRQGPAVHPDLAADGMRRWLAAHGYDESILTVTEVPLRRGI